VSSQEVLGQNFTVGLKKSIEKQDDEGHFEILFLIFSVIDLKVQFVYANQLFVDGVLQGIL